MRMPYCVIVDGGDGCATVFGCRQGRRRRRDPGARRADSTRRPRSNRPGRRRGRHREVDRAQRRDRGGDRGRVRGVDEVGQRARPSSTVRQSPRRHRPPPVPPPRLARPPRAPRPPARRPRPRRPTFSSPPVPWNSPASNSSLRRRYGGVRRLSSVHSLTMSAAGHELSTSGRGRASSDGGSGMMKVLLVTATASPSSRGVLRRVPTGAAGRRESPGRAHTAGRGAGRADWDSMPSATVSSSRVRASSSSPRTIAGSLSRSVMGSMNERSILRMSTGNWRR